MSAPALPPNKLRELMRKGEPTLGIHVHSPWPGITELIGQSNTVDYIEFSSSNVPFDLFVLDNIARAAELHHMSTMIKLDPEPKDFWAQRSIGAGFQSLLFADLRSVEEVQEAVAAVRAEPEGHNGSWMHRVEGYLLEAGTENFAKYANDIVVAIMIEKKPLYDKLEDVLNLDGVDMIQFGPGDFAMSVGHRGNSSHPVVREAEERTIKLALKYDKHPRAEINAALTGSFEKDLERYQNLGVKDFCNGDDMAILHQWLQTIPKITKQKLGATQA